jgi:hypothetical protein
MIVCCISCCPAFTLVLMCALEFSFVKNLIEFYLNKIMELLKLLNLSPLFWPRSLPGPAYFPLLP